MLRYFLGGRAWYGNHNYNTNFATSLVVYNVIQLPATDCHVVKLSYLKSSFL